MPWITATIRPSDLRGKECPRTVLREQVERMKNIGFRFLSEGGETMVQLEAPYDVRFDDDGTAIYRQHYDGDCHEQEQASQAA